MSRPTWLKGKEARPFSSAKKSRKRPARQEGRRLYRKSCVSCHDTDGKGRIVRGALPRIPDFTSAKWHRSHTDAQLVTAILKGKGEKMPGFSGKINRKQAKALVTYVRSFGHRRVKKQAAAPKQRGTETALRRPAKAARRDDAATALAQKGRGFFRKRCVSCHGADGRAGTLRKAMPQIPDFTNGKWHQSRSDAQLRAAILDGKGKQMPAFSRLVNPKQVQALIAYVRSLGPRTGKAAATPAESDFEMRFRELEKEFQRLQKEFRALSRSSKNPQGSKKPDGRKVK
jgi:mono/diheme cytochrome c family protein